MMSKLLEKFLVSFNFGLVVILILQFCFKPIHATICPTASMIMPCTCNSYFNLIECSNISTDTDLYRIFTNLKNELDRQRVRPIYDDFKLVQSHLERIGRFGENGQEDILAEVVFRRISVLRNPNLKRIDPGAFSSSFNTTTEIVIEDNNLLGSNVDDNVALFQLLSQFNGLNTLHLTDNGVRFIPSEAFSKNQPALRKLFLTNNRIERIENSAFVGLNSLDIINLDGNQINKFEPRSLEMKNNSSGLLRIFLRSNKLKAESFPIGLFSRLHRRCYLNLNMNNITKLSRDVFQSFFKRKSVLSVLKNPLKCDCDFKWLLDQKLLYNSSNPKHEYFLRDYQCVTEKDDEQLIDEVDQADFELCSNNNLNKENPEPWETCLQSATNPDEEELCFNGAITILSTISIFTWLVLSTLINIFIFSAIGTN